MLRLGLTERGVTEILGIAEHVTSLAAAAEGLRLRPDVPLEPSDPRTELLGPATDGAPALGAIASWTQAQLGIGHVPGFWRVLARRPRALEAVWAKHELVLGAGELDARTKAFVALAVAMSRPSPYWIDYLAQLTRHAYAATDDEILETAAALLHIRAFNTIAHGMMLEPQHRDIVAAEFMPEADH